MRRSSLDVVSRAFTAISAVALLCVLAPALASAAVENPFVETFSSANKPVFAHDQGMAVDQSTGDLLVIDASASTVSRWHTDGTPSNFSALGTNVIDGKGAADLTPQNGINVVAPNESQVVVDNSGTATNGNIYVTNAYETISIFASTGAYLGQLTGFGESCGVAVDPAGNVYVGDYQNGIVKYVPSGNKPVNADPHTTLPVPEVCTLAAGAGPTSGFLFAVEYSGPVRKVNSTTGAVQYVVSAGSTNTTSTVDPLTGHVYVAKASEVNKYDASGAVSPTLLTFVKAAAAVEGVAVDGSRSRIYLSRGATGNVQVYGPPMYSLAVNSAGGTGTGTVKCKVGAGPTEACKAKYAEGTELTLVPEPPAGNEFAGFASGTGSASACAGVSPCTITLNANSTVSAPFNLAPGQRKLTIGVVSNGQVKCNGGACAPNYAEGSTITLEAVPGANYFFGGWSAVSGSGTVTTPCAGAVSPCEVKLDNHVTGTATFAPILHTLNLTTVGPGTVQCKVGAGSFAPCQATYIQSETVTLKTLPTGYSYFTGWSAVSGSGSVATPCAGTVTECEVKIDSEVSATATFSPIPPGTETAHIHSTSFNVPDPPISVAADEATGSIYVLGATGSIYKYDPSGSPSNFTSLGTNVLSAGCGAECQEITVDNSGRINQGVIYVGSSAFSFGAAVSVRVFLPNGRPSTGITAGNGNPHCGVAVDRQGVVYVIHSGPFALFETRGGEAISAYRPGQIHPDPDPPQIWPQLALIKTPDLTAPCQGSVDSKSRVYVTDNSMTQNVVQRNIYRFKVDPFAARELAPTIVDTGSTGTAVDQSTNDLYSNHKTSITRFNEDGEPREVFGFGHLVGSSSIALNSEMGTVYATNQFANEVQVFTTVPLPNVTATSAQSSQTTAELSASVDPSDAGDIGSCDFEYGLTTAYGITVPCEEATPYVDAQDVSASLSSLAKETKYHYRVVAANAYGTTVGPDKTFNTHNVAGVSTDAPTDVTQTSATLNGSFEGNEEATNFHFEWGPTSSYGNVTPGDSAGAPLGPTSVSAPITGLEANLPDSEPYHYRLVAENASGTTFGPDRSFFAAPPNAPELSGIEASVVHSEDASISAVVNPRGAPSVYWIEYGTEQSYGSSTPQSNSVGDDETGHGVTTNLVGLAPGTTYHYRVVASNFGGATSSADHTFDTPAVPVVESVSSSAIGETAATLEARINPGFRPTTYRFEYGLTRAYGTSTPETGLGAAGNVAQPATATVGNLKPGVTYHYRVVATNDQGIGVGADQSLTTVPLPAKKQTRPIKPTGQKCKRGFVKRRGKCVKKPKAKRKRHGSKNRGQR